jgi:hypothetical protein
MKVISEFVDHRNGKRYPPGPGDQIDPPLEDAEIDRLKKAGCLADDDDAAPRLGPGGVPASRTEMRTEAGEAAHRDADARARSKAQQATAADSRTAAKPTLTLPAGEDGVAGRTKSPTAGQAK